MKESLFHGDMVTSTRIIYTPSTFARTNLLHLQEIGELQAEKPHTSQRSNLQSHLFMIVVSGSGTLTYRGTDYELSSGQCVWINCHNAYAHHTSENLWKLQWVHFFGPSLNAIYDKYLERGGTPVINTQNATAFTQQWHRLFDTAQTVNHIRDMHINEQLTSLLTLLMAESWHPESQPRATIKRQNLQQIKDYLDTHYADKITLDDLSKRFFINKFYLTRIFKEQFGMTINTYLTTVRITHAKYLLRFTELSMEEIAIACGLQNANYLNRVFRRFEGIGPGGYRKDW